MIENCAVSDLQSHRRADRHPRYATPLIAALAMSGSSLLVTAMR